MDKQLLQMVKGLSIVAMLDTLPRLTSIDTGTKDLGYCLGTTSWFAEIQQGHQRMR